MENKKTEEKKENLVKPDFMYPPFKPTAGYILIKSPDVVDAKGGIYLGNASNDGTSMLEKQCFTVVDGDDEILESANIKKGDEIAVRLLISATGNAVPDVEGSNVWHKEIKEAGRPTVVLFSYTYFYIRTDAILGVITNKEEIPNFKARGKF